MPKYTKVPWLYVGNRVVGQGKTVADVRFKNGDNDGPLLAAAPELLEALKACHLQMLQSNNDSEYAQEANELAKAAIAKAEATHA